jgi:hypothetical protein
MITPDPNIDRNATGYELVPGRTYVHVAAILSNGQRTARWSLNTQTGTWYWSEGWKRRGRMLPASVAEYAQGIYDQLVEA